MTYTDSFRGITYRQCDSGAGGWVRDGGDRHWTHCAATFDISADHRTYPTGYDPECGWCYLGAAHTVDAHAASIAGEMFS